MQELRPEERREFQRLRLPSPIPAMLGGTGVAIREIGVLGARIQHTVPVSGQQPELRFDHRNREIAIRCDFARTITEGESGVRFVGAIGDSGIRLRQMLGRLVTEAINARRGPSDTVLTPPGDGEDTIARRDNGFICYRFENQHWTKRSVFLPEQPSAGFTVARNAHADEIDQLCRLYEASDEEGRRLVRVFAELSVSDVLQIPPAV
jgi:hypothetical protein